MDGGRGRFKAAPRFVSPPFSGKTGRMRLAAAFLFLLAMAPTARAETVHEALDAYALYQADVSALLELEITSAADIDNALERASRHDPARVTRGWIAYGALTAAQSPAFAAGVQSRVRAAGRAPVLRQLRRDLTYARRRPPGSGEAIQLVLASVAADSARTDAAGRRYLGIGEALDTCAWVISAERGAREARLRRPGEQRLTPAMIERLHIGPLAAAPLTDANAFGGRRFWDALAGRQSEMPRLDALRERRASTTDRMLTLAGLIVVGAAESETARVAAVMDDARTRECLALEQLQFRQCASVAHDPNEDAFCLARHGWSAPSACFSAMLL
jgi:hypothetical protein